MKSARHYDGGRLLVPGHSQMAMGSHRFKLSGTPRKRGAGDRNDHGSADVAILSIGADSLFRDDVPVLSSCKKNRAVDDVFHSLLSETNRELASLLRDVRTGASGTPLGDARSQHVSELLMPKIEIGDWGQPCCPLCGEAVHASSRAGEPCSYGRTYRLI